LGQRRWLGARVLLGLALACCSAPVDGVETDFACFNCMFEPNSTTPMKLRAMYLTSGGVVVNKAAKSKATEIGMMDWNCDDPEKSLPECFVGTNWNDGWVGELTFRIFTSLGVDVVAMTRANFSEESALAYTGVSSFTRCVWEVQLGKVDICVGDFWEMPARRRLAPFTSVMALDSMFLVTRNLGAKPFDASNLVSWAKPFTSDVWGVVIGAFLIFGISLWFVEAPSEDNRDFDDTTKLGSPMGFLLTSWMSFMAFFIAAPMHAATTWPGRIILLGFAFLIYILVASYTASLASLLVADKAAVTFVEGLSEVRAKSRKLCMLEPLETTVDIDPANKRLIDDYGPMLDQVKRSVCGAAIVGQKEYRSYILSQENSYNVCQDPEDEKQLSSCADPEKKSTRVELNCQCSDPEVEPEECPLECPFYHNLCSLIKVENLGQLAIPFSMPVAAKFQDTISAWIVELKFGSEGDYIAALMAKHNALVDENGVLPDACGNEDSGGEGGDQLGIQDMAGTFVFSGAVMVLGIIVHLVQMVMKARAPKEAEEEHIPGVEHESESAQAIAHLQKTVSQINKKLDDLAASIAAGSSGVSAHGAAAPSVQFADEPVTGGLGYPGPSAHRRGSNENESLSKPTPFEPAVTSSPSDDNGNPIGDFFKNLGGGAR